MKLISDLRQLYSNATVYEDAGQIITKCGKVERRTDFETKFHRPNFHFSFVAEYIHELPSKEKGFLSSDGKHHSFKRGSLAARHFPTLCVAIGAATAHGGGIANLIATLLLPAEDCSNILDLCYETSEEVIEDTECYKLVSMNDEGKTELWISRSSLNLIRVKECSAINGNLSTEQCLIGDANYLFGSEGVERYKAMDREFTVYEDCWFSVKLLCT